MKENAPELLRLELSSPKWKPQELAMSGVTDCYQPVECRLRLTRRCLAVLAEFRNPVSIITRIFLVTRDLDLLRDLAAYQAVHVNISINSLDGELAPRIGGGSSGDHHNLRRPKQGDARCFAWTKRNGQQRRNEFGGIGL